MTSSPAPQAPIAARGADSRPPLALAPRLGGALAAGLLMTAALRLLFAQPGYAPAGGVLAAAAVAMAPRLGWLAASAFLITWLAVTGAPGAALIVACAVLPVALTLRRPGPAWSAPALAPLAGVAGVAGLFPALAAQSGSWPRRASVGALGFWWLMLAQPLASRRLWLGPPDGSLERAAWAHTLSGAVTHALEPLLIPGMLAGAALWALGAAVLPWLVRGRNAARDLLAASTWGVLLAVGAGSLERSLVPVGGASWPRGLVLGTVGAVLLAVGGRALRGPGRPLGRAHPPAIGRRESEGQEPV